MSNETLKCPIPHNAQPTLEVGKRTEKKEKFSEYPKEIQFLGLILVEFGMCSQKDAESLLQVKKQHNVREWFDNVLGHVVDTITIIGKRDVLYFIKSNFGGILIGKIYRELAKITNTKLRNLLDYDYCNQKSHKELLRMIRLHKSVFYLCRHGVVTSAIKISQDKSSFDQEMKIFLESFSKILFSFGYLDISPEILEEIKNDYSFELYNGVSVVQKRSKGKIVHPSTCTFENKSTISDGSGNGYTGLSLGGGKLDPDGRVFFDNSICPFTTLVGGYKEQ